MRSFLHDGKRLIITAPYNEIPTAVSNGNRGVHALKNGNLPNDLKLQRGASPTSSTCSIAGSVNSTLGSTH
jgi:hypothetical protein